METNKLNISDYFENGYVVLKSFFKKEVIDKINLKIDNLKSKIAIPHTDIPMGYGNLIDNEDFKIFYENKRIKDMCTTILSKNFAFNHLIVHEKPAWIGLGHEWHQESVNISSFAPGLNWQENWQDFLQIFIPLDYHTIENGCLKIIPGSHKFGLLENEDIIAGHLTHKRRIKHTELTRIEKTNKILNCILSPGDVLLFNHLTAHGSSNNNSSKRRRVAVMQARKDSFKKEKNILNDEMNFRINFAIKTLDKKIKILSKDRKKYYEEVIKYTLKSRNKQ